MSVDLAGVRSALARDMPAMLDRAAESYRIFADQDPPEDAKGFAAHHAACRSALNHLDGLLKLARWASGEDTAAASAAGLIAEARAALSQKGDDDD